MATDEKCKTPHFLATYKSDIRHILTDTKLTCFVVPSLFSKSECEAMLNTDVKKSFQKASSNYPTYYRNNDRFVVDDDDLAKWLFQKVKAYLPPAIEVNSAIETEEGIWYLNALNNRIRFCKYSANQYFHRHLDGVHYQSETTQSKLTFMIYLNGATAFQGGRTLFFRTKETEEIWAAYTPNQGDLIVFDHNVWHEGEVLTQGEKFVLRSDILYSKKEKEVIKAPFVGHLGYIWSLLKFNGNTIISAGRDKEIKIWSAIGEQKYALKAHQNSVICIEKMSDDVFVSGSRDQQIIVWKDYSVSNKLKIHSAIVLSLCRLDNYTFASSSGDGTVKIVDLAGSVLKIFTEHTNWVWKVIKLDDRIIASCSEDNSIKIWNCDIEHSIYTFYTNVPIISLAFNHKTRQLISGNLTGDIYIMTLNDSYQPITIETFRAHNGIIRTIKVIRENFIATGGEDNKVNIWNLNGCLIATLEHQNFVQAIDVLDDDTIMSASYDGTIKTWKI